METILSFLSIGVMIWFILVLFKPQKFSPFFRSHPRWKALGVFLITIMIIGSVVPEHKNNVDNMEQATIKDEPEKSKDELLKEQHEKEKQKEQAKQEINGILQDLYAETDEVEKQTWYKSIQGVYPPETRLYWYAGVKDSDIWERAKMVHFSDRIEWVFWKKIIFSTNEGKWEYNVSTLSGQDGEKKIEIVRGGKYEYSDLEFDKIKPGIKVLISGTNPIIRLAGRQRYEDYHLSAEDIKNLKLGYRLSELLKKTDNKIM